MTVRLPQKRWLMATVVLTWASFLLPQQVRGDELFTPPYATPSSRECTTTQFTAPMRIVAYNVHLLPDIAARLAGKRGESAYRAQAIGKQLAGFDLIGISEAFDHDYTQDLIGTLQSNLTTPFAIAHGPKRSGGHLIGSGLVLASRWPIEQTHTITYSQASRFLTDGFKADGFAAKGALHARIRIGNGPNARVDCFLTHLESRSSSARQKQITELSKFISLYATDNYPLVIMGDFNVNADETDRLASAITNTPYQQLLSSLSHQGRQLYDLGRLCPPHHRGTRDAMVQGGDRRIDYVFMSNSKSAYTAKLHPRSAQTLAMLDARVPEGSLSDHLAIFCQADFRWLDCITIKAARTPSTRR